MQPVCHDAPGSAFTTRSQSALATVKPSRLKTWGGAEPQSGCVAL